MPDLLFVYGTLRRGNRNAMAEYLARHAGFVADGWFQGRMYHISYYPGVIASVGSNDRVYGEVYRLTDTQAMLSVLDDYEECGQQHTPPTEYKRVTTRIHVMDGKVIENVWIYLYQWPVEDKVHITAGDFMKVRQVA